MTNEVKTNETKENGLPRRQNHRTNERTARVNPERRETKTSNYRPRRKTANIREQREKEESTKTVEKVVEEKKNARRMPRNTGVENKNRVPRETRSADRETKSKTKNTN